MALNDLPLETFLEILKRIDGCSLGRCREVCNQWKEIIDATSFLWQAVCEKDFKYSSKIAKRKAGDECQWYHIYKNLKMWSNISLVQKKLREFYKFNNHDNCHALEADNNILPLRESKGFVFYEVDTLKYLPVVIQERKCFKISHNDSISVILTKTGVFLQRTVENRVFKTDAFFRADNFVLSKDALYFFNNRDVFKCSLIYDDFLPKLILHCDYDIKEMQVHNNIIYLFTDCGKIVTISGETNVSVKPISIPIEWIRQIKHIRALDDKNFVCYSRNLFKIETDKYQHLYLDFPPITALFFYGDVVIIGTRAGEISLYRLSSQKRATKPIFENLAVLPEDKFALHLDVCERKTGPVIIIATFFEIFSLEFEFFPDEQIAKKSFTPNKLNIYKRLLKLRDKFRETIK